MRVLLSEGSGLTARQVALRLGALGHEVELLSSEPLCLARFTRHVRRVHRVPPFGADPLAWLDAALAVVRARRVEMLFPTQEQVTVLSACSARIGVMTVVPPFGALRRVQDKVSAWRTLEALGLPQPPTVVVDAGAPPPRVETFPVFVKRPISTASSGVRRADGPVPLREALAALGPGELLVQQGIAGPLAMVQALADRGRLVAWHANLRVREGVGGGAAVKESLALPALRRPLERLLAELAWHGPLSMDVIVGAEGPVVIDLNPRLVEPANAGLAGVDLVGAMLELARGGHPALQAEGRSGVRSCQRLLGVLGAAQQADTRRAVAREIAQSLLGRGAYAGAVEELTPTAGDPWAAVPWLAAAAATLLWPPAWRVFAAGAVTHYALTPAAWQRVLDAC